VTRSNRRSANVPRSSVVDVAIAHDYLTQRGGAEKVVLAMHRGFSHAPLYTTLYSPAETYPEFGHIDVRTSVLNRFSVFRRFHRLAFPFLAFVSQRFRVPARLTIVSSSGWAHGFLTAGSKIVYCYSPARWLYQSESYLGEGRSLKRTVLQLMRARLRRWDRRHARSATKYFAISTVVRERIWQAYGIEAEVLPAPHSVDVSAAQEPLDLTAIGSPDVFYLCISRLLPYKNVDVVVEAFNELNLPLVVVGAGPQERELAGLAGANVLLVKNLSDAQIRWLYAHSAAIVAASFEDYGLTPIEAAAYGKPSVVLRWGGFLDTVREEETGVYFDQPKPAMVAAAVLRSRQIEWDSQKLVSHSDTFGEAAFIERLRDELTRARASQNGSGR